MPAHSGIVLSPRITSGDQVLGVGAVAALWCAPPKAKRTPVDVRSLAMKIRTLLITAASVIALSSAAMADDHHANAVEHGLSNKPNSPALINDLILGRGAGQGSPFVGHDTAVPASRTIEEKKPPTFIRQCEPGNPGRCFAVP